MNPTPKENQHTSTSQFDEKAKTEARSLQDIIINSVAIGSIYLIFGYIISLSLGLGTRVILSRTLGAETYGYFAIILAISTVTYLFIIFALDFSLLRYIPSKIDKPQEVTKTIYSVILVLIIPSLIFTSLIILLREWLATIFLGNPLLAFSISIGAFLAPFFAYYTLVYSIFQGFQDMKSVMIINIIQAVILVNLTILFLWLGFGLIGAIFSFLGAGISAVFFGLYRLRRKHLVSIPKWQLHIPKSLLLLGLLVYVIQFFDVISASSGLLLLGYFGLAASAGIFSICWMFSEVAFNITQQVVYRAFFPLVSEMKKDRNPNIGEVFNRFIRYTLLGSILLYLPLFLLPELILPIFGPEFILGTPAWRILIIGFFFRTFSQPPEAFLIIEERRRFTIGLHSIASILSVIFAFLLIPVLDFIGVAIASFIWNFTIFAAVWIYFLRTHKFRLDFFYPRLDDLDKAVLRRIFRRTRNKME